MGTYHVPYPRNASTRPPIPCTCATPQNDKLIGRATVSIMQWLKDGYDGDIEIQDTSQKPAGKINISVKFEKPDAAAPPAPLGPPKLGPPGPLGAAPKLRGPPGAGGRQE